MRIRLERWPASSNMEWQGMQLCWPMNSGMMCHGWAGGSLDARPSGSFHASPPRGPKSVSCGCHFFAHHRLWDESHNYAKAYPTLLPSPFLNIIGLETLGWQPRHPSCATSRFKFACAIRPDGGQPRRIGLLNAVVPCWRGSHGRQRQTWRSTRMTMRRRRPEPTAAPEREPGTGR